ncbi:MAG: metallophosphoesterase [bacterium]
MAKFKKTVQIQLFLLIICSLLYGAIVRKPYLQPTVDLAGSIGIAWRTQETAKGKVWYREKGASVWLISEETADTNKHFLVVQGLNQGTIYEYKVEESGEVNSFRTSPADGNIKVGIISDVHAHGSTIYPAFNVAMDHILAFNADILLILGDISDCPDKPVENYVDGIRDLFTWRPDAFGNMIVCPVPGNHDWQDPLSDIGGRDHNYYRQEWHLPENGPASETEREMHYSFDYGKSHFTMTTNYYNWPAAEGKTFAQYDVKDASERSELDFIFLCHHAQTIGNTDNDYCYVQSTRMNFMYTTCNYGVDINFFGHRHHYYRTYPLKQFISPVPPLLRWKPSTAEKNSYTPDDMGTILSMIPSLQYSLANGVLNSSIIAYYEPKVGFAEMTINERILTLKHYNVAGAAAYLGDEYTIDKSSINSAFANREKLTSGIIPFPNPFTKKIFIPVNMQNSLSQSMELKIYSLLGVMVRSIKIKPGADIKSGVYWNGLDNSGKPVNTGNYIYKYLDNDNRIISKRVILY